MSLLEMVIRLVVSVLLGALIGLERETHGRPAGLRTHILVCFGATLFTLSSYQMAGTRFDPARVTAQIVTGVGFLGAGTIIHQGSVIRGLTTAASIWTVAAIGVAAGIGGQMLYLAAVASILVFVVLSLMPRVEALLTAHKDERSLNITTSLDTEHICDILSILSKHNIRIHMISRDECPEENVQLITLRIRLPAGLDEQALNRDLTTGAKVISCRWD
ncbi:MAG: MgtC/SapB family protein [Armatimonadota bacterium]|nr:MgtC/SapB family protein [bacterium]